MSQAQTPVHETEVTAFTRNEYRAGTQNWAALRDDKNRLYFANNEGLLIYNGSNWQLYPVPNKTILRSLGRGPEGKIYVGAQDELGYFSPDARGQLQYTSLLNRLPEKERKFADVWELEIAGNEVFFRTSTSILKLHDQTFTIFPARSTWLSLHIYQGKVLAHDADEGLLIFEKNAWKTGIPARNLPGGFSVTDIIGFNKDSSLLSTGGHGLFWFTGNQLLPFLIEQEPVLNKQPITSIAKRNDSSFWMGTYYQGAYLLSASGNILKSISTQNGLPGNTVRFVETDSTGLVWFGLDNGLACYTPQTPVTHINPPAFNKGAGYQAMVWNDDIYFALSTGLFRAPVASNGDLRRYASAPLNMLQGLTWDITTWRDQLLAGRDDGLWKISKEGTFRMASGTGFWGSRFISETEPPYLAAGNYAGIRLFQQMDSGLTDRGQLKYFTESSRYLEADHEYIWVSHPYRGVYRINLQNNTVQAYGQREGLPEDLNNAVFTIKGKIVFATGKGIYSYQPGVNRIVKDPAFEPVFGNLPIRYLKEDSFGNIWFIQDKMLGVADYQHVKPVLRYIPELQNRMVSGFESIYPYDANNVLVGAETGFYHIQYDLYRQTIKPFSAYLSLVKTIGKTDSVLFGGFANTKIDSPASLRIPYSSNSIQFSAAATLLNPYASTEFSFYLEGFDKGWSDWVYLPTKEYTNLPPGHYIFKVKARSGPSQESSVTAYRFSISPPWYRNPWAYLLYALAAVAFLFMLMKMQSYKHKKRLETRRQNDLRAFEEDQRQMAYQHQLQLEKNEKEKLGAEIEHKNAELASATLNILHKKEFILKIKSELQHLQKNARIEDENHELRRLLKVLADEEKLDDEWNLFQQHFDTVHGDFISTVKSRFPMLKPHELKLCAYLRMNLSSKEIAPLMSISIRGVEISRYRLRKKMGLPTEVNLVQYLLDLS